MLNKTIIAVLALGALLMGSVALAETNTASTTAPVFKPLPVTFPIADLGGCASKEACRVYCEDAAHRDACYSYAQTHGLMRQDEIQKARQFIKEHASSLAGQATPPRIKPREASSTPQTGPKSPNASIDATLKTVGGPGGCTTREECKVYCDDATHAEECLLFAKAHKLMDDREIELAKKLQAQVGPGGCKGEQCKQYCKDSEHAQVCVTFAQQNGFISNDDAQKRLERVKFASTTKPLPMMDERKIKQNSLNREGTSTKPFNQKPPPPPPRPNASSSSEQGGSIFFAILHFFGL